MIYNILVIEDDPDVQELISEFLITQNYHVDKASDGVEGLKLFQTENYHLVIADIMMPNMDGFHLCNMIRRKSSVPIIILTALSEEKSELKAFDLQVDDYITKPFSFNVLIKRVQAVIRRAYPENVTRTASFKEIVVDYEAYTVKMNGEVIELTTKEFDILKLFIENEGKVLSRELLLDQLWGFDYFGDTRVVDTHIKNLRKKLDVPYIKTIKGVGYKLEI
ncbi:response regulator transcription factor [Lysinibacillus cavernae]|uniref:response regulator transcription factor n=1 Tax=Lysinibacillus cavernae TaxID=2666135 RepID=UPI0012D8BCC7|nr:response regulator transcription factor [Lysinibacillus cavernae]